MVPKRRGPTACAPRGGDSRGRVMSADVEARSGLAGPPRGFSLQATALQVAPEHPEQELCQVA